MWSEEDKAIYKSSLILGTWKEKGIEGAHKLDRQYQGQFLIITTH